MCNALIVWSWTPFFLLTSLAMDPCPSAKEWLIVAVWFRHRIGEMPKSQNSTGSSNRRRARPFVHGTSSLDMPTIKVLCKLPPFRISHFMIPTGRSSEGCKTTPMICCSENITSRELVPWTNRQAGASLILLGHLSWASGIPSSDPVDRTKELTWSLAHIAWSYME